MFGKKIKFIILITTFFFIRDGVAGQVEWSCSPNISGFVTNDFWQEYYYPNSDAPVPVGQAIPYDVNPSVIKCFGVINGGGSLNGFKSKDTIWGTPTQIGAGVWSGFGSTDWSGVSGDSSLVVAQTNFNNWNASVVINTPGTYPVGTIGYTFTNKVRINLAGSGDGDSRFPKYTVLNEKPITVVNPTCFFNVNNVSVTLPDYIDENYRQTVPLTYQCYSTTGSNTPVIKLRGTSVSSDNSIFENQDASTDKATGIGFRFWANNTLLRNNQNFTYPSVSTGIARDLGLQVSYKKTGASISAGKVSTTLIIEITHS